MNINGRQFLAGVLLLAQMASGCTSWRVMQVAPQELLVREHPEAIRVQEKGGSTYVLRNPVIDGDSLMGTLKHVSRRIPLATVDAVAVRKFSTLKTLGLVLGVPALAVAGLAIGCAATHCLDFSFGNWSY
jgi:hypothetical protein